MLEKILSNLKITALNEMQKAILEAAKTTSDILLLSPTGSGKTLGFLLPVLENIKSEINGVQALILVPSRELALQIEQVFRLMGTGFKINCCYGGHAVKVEKNNFTHPPSVLVGTPGRIAYHVRNRTFDTSGIHTLVLDEFDKALEFGFQEDMSYIIFQLRNLKRRILTSATNLEQIPEFTGVENPLRMSFLEDKSPVKASLKLRYLQAEDNDKLQLLFELICYLQNKPSLVFCNHRDAVERISALLSEHGLAHGVFHGGMDQEDRERALIKFRNGSYCMLITTDLASRGLDIPEIEAVVHYQLPASEDVFTHRNGRTARMNASGSAYLMLAIEDHLPDFLTETPEKLQLPDSFDLPEKAPWRTIYIGSGKKEKVNKMDIVGLMLQKGKLEKDELGRVEVLDHFAYAAVKSDKIESVLGLIRGEKIKNKKVKFDISR
jgi:ATP-independent RNA helicase DbpA